MDKKTILAFVLVGLIIFLWPVFNEKVVGIKSPVKQKTVESSEAEELTTQENKEEEDSIEPNMKTD